MDKLSRVPNIQSEIGSWFRNSGGCAGVRAQLLRAQTEFAELMTAVTAEQTREECADVAMCLFVAAEVAGFDLIAAVTEKLAINEQRKWTVDADGNLHHIHGSDPRGE